MKNENNAKLTAVRNKNGYILLTLSVEGFEGVSIKVNDFGGTQKQKARKIAYALYKKVGQ